jgi:hypothetical protein
VIEVVVLLVTVAVTPSNFTVLFAAVALKFEPVIVTAVPTGPYAGLKEDIVGAVVPLPCLIMLIE